ncbi:MAG: methyltransferase domain-containing protein [Candidatus Rokuibacteriota bacterium]
MASKTLTAFLSLVFSRPAAELVDLGPVVGSNIAFLGERIGCKIHVEDLYADLDRHARLDTLDEVPKFLGARFALPDESVDAVLGWDVFDYLAPAAAGVLAGELMRMLRPGGVLLAFFGGRGPGDLRYTKYVIEDEAHIRYRFYATACRRQPVLENRDIIKLFAGLDVSDSLLLKSGVREVLFRKPDRGDMGAPTWPPSPPRSARPGGAAARLVNPTGSWRPGTPA